MKSYSLVALFFLIITSNQTIAKSNEVEATYNSIKKDLKTNKKNNGLEISPLCHNDINTKIGTKSFESFKKEVNLSLIELLSCLKNNNPNTFLNLYKYLYYNGCDTSLVEGILIERKLKEHSNNPVSAHYLPTKADFSYFYNYGIKNGINWKEVEVENIEMFENSNFVKFLFRLHNTTFIISLRFQYDEVEDVGIIYFPCKLSTTDAFNYNLEMRSQTLEKQEEISSYRYGRLSEIDLKFIEDQYIPCCIYMNIANNYFVNGNYIDAIPRLTKIIKEYSLKNCGKCQLVKIQNVYFLRGRCKLKLKDNLGALNDFNSCFNLKPTQLPKYYYYYKAKAKVELKDFLGGLQDFDKALKINPSDDDSYLERGLLKYFELKNKKGGCLDWSKSGEFGRKEAYELIKEYCK